MKKVEIETVREEVGRGGVLIREGYLGTYWGVGTSQSVGTYLRRCGIRTWLECIINKSERKIPC